MVRELLGTPDVQGRDPRRWSPAPLRLYLLARVETVERTPEFAATSANSGGSSAATAHAERRRAAVLAAIRALQFGEEQIRFRGEVFRAAPGQAEARVTALGLADRYTGLRLTRGGPEHLSAEPDLLLAELERAVRACVERDGARAVVIGGGPLGDAAEGLRTRCAVRIVAPIPAACRALARLPRR
ncbi:aspartate/glutamate racemase family protein [Streptomyces aureus]|uniref:aspartate/glutamate racemase family protein n=1 Tax=Streptomyces aureus TaxID=193461 RepID=UPI000B131C20|nr:aspartate/glutamate racemase family protein [Streptomyces aureus]